MKLGLTLKEIANIVGGEIIGNSSQIIDHIYTDSRKNLAIENSAFLAISGDYNNGHDYLEHVFSKGIKTFIVEDPKKLPQNVNAIVVNDTLRALQKLAKYHRLKHNIPVIGITGSYGKTIVKEWLYHCLSDHYDIVRSPKSFNTLVGVPLSVLEIRKEHTLAIFEADSSNVGEMEIIANIIQPTIGILTNIELQHSDHFSNKEELQNEKMQLLNAANQKILFSPIPEIDSNQIDSFVEINWNNIKYKTPFIDDGSAQNALTVIKTLIALGIPTDDIQTKLKNLPTIALRLETFFGANNSILVNDSDNTDLNALVIALDYLNKFDSSKNKIAILSDVHLDISSHEVAYNKIKTIIEQHNVKELIGIGKDFVKYKDTFPGAHIFTTTQDFVNRIHEFNFSDKIILLKGAKRFRFNSIIDQLKLKSHQTTLNINLNRLLHNVNQFKQLLHPNTKLLCMIKAFGYGYGIKEIASYLNHNSVDYLGVAYTDEGVYLRKENIESPIMVMNAEITSFNDVTGFKLEPSIYNLNQLDLFIRHCIENNIQEYPIHIKIDSGMNRLGFKENQIPQLIALLKSQPEVSVKSIFSHLAVADDPKKDQVTYSQIEKFKRYSNIIIDALGHKPLLHILNSKGIERFTEAQFDMVRLGIGMYGVTSTNLKLEPVATLASVIVDIKNVKKGECIGYGCYEAKRDSKIGILPIGYADGYNRKLSNGVGVVAVNGKTCPTIGKISMDMLAIDITDIECNEGDQVELFGSTILIQEIAKKLDTISYEIMTGISSRVSRQYFEE